MTYETDALPQIFGLKNRPTFVFFSAKSTILSHLSLRDKDSNLRQAALDAEVQASAAQRELDEAPADICEHNKIATGSPCAKVPVQVLIELTTINKQTGGLNQHEATASNDFNAWST